MLVASKRGVTSAPQRASFPHSFEGHHSIDHVAETIREQLPVERDRRRLAFLLFYDQPGVFERLPVVTEQRQTYSQTLRYLRAAHVIAIRQHLHHPEPRWV